MIEIETTRIIQLSRLGLICGPTSPAAAGVVLVQVVLQRVPATPHPHHHVGAQNLNSGHVKHPRLG